MVAKTRFIQKITRGLKNSLKKWLQSIKKPISYTRTRINTIFKRFTRYLTTCLKRWSLYSRCDELLLDRFIKCLNGDLSALKKVRFVPKSWMKEAWTSINEEYARDIDNNKYVELTKSLKDIFRDSLRLMIADSCVQVLLNKHSENAAGVLRNLGYKYKFDPSNKDSYIRDLTRVMKNLKMLSLELETNKKSYNARTTVKATTKEHVTETLVSLSRFMQFRIDPGKTTVKEYVNMMNQYKKEIEINLKQWQQKK